MAKAKTVIVDHARDVDLVQFPSREPETGEHGEPQCESPQKECCRERCFDGDAEDVEHGNTGCLEGAESKRDGADCGDDGGKHKARVSHPKGNVLTEGIQHD